MTALQQAVLHLAATIVGLIAVLVLVLAGHLSPGDGLTVVIAVLGIGGVGVASATSSTKAGS